MTLREIKNVLFLWAGLTGFSLHASLVCAESTASNLIDVLRSPEGVISLEGPTCQELVQEEQALRSWTLKGGETPGPQSLPLEAPDHSRCRLNIDHSIPRLARSLHGLKAAFSGPNCWNTSLRLSGLLPFSRFSNSAEMTLWMNSPYCRELAASEKSLPGDIIAIRAQKPNQPPDFEEIHGMIYLSDSLVFSKNTSSRMSPFGIQRANLVYQNFQIASAKCAKVHGPSQECYRWANHYRCTSADTARRAFEKMNPQFQVLSAEGNGIEAIFSEKVMKGQGDYEAHKEVLQKQLLDLEAKTLKLQNTSGENAFFVNALLHKITSLKDQAAILNRQGPR